MRPMNPPPPCANLGVVFCSLLFERFVEKLEQLIRRSSVNLLSIGLLTVAVRGDSFSGVTYNSPAGWDGPQFAFSQNYPAVEPAPGPLPWESIQFQDQPAAYAMAVLNYCFEGNVGVDFDPQKNTQRSWVHAPWLRREFVRGLTRERTSQPFELAATQDKAARNFAVGFYNDRGGYEIGRVWKDHQAPAYDHVAFPEGTVSFKLLFTTASVADVPFLQGSPEWYADLDRSADPAKIKSNKIRLLQIDIAVRDARSFCGGWVFGTFHFDSSLPGSDPWQKLRPLTLLWGNDPFLTQTMFEQGTKPVESWVNADSPVVKYRSHPPAGVHPPRTLGWAGRGNGPVDNPVSSCLSCHGTAQLPAKSNMTPPNNATEQERLRWFRNLAPHSPFDAGSKTLDFSLQLAVGLQNFQQAQTAGTHAVAAFGAKVLVNPLPGEFRFTRDPDSPEEQ